MFQNIIDDFKESAGTTLRLTSLAGAAALFLVVTVSFVGAALFILVLQSYGPIEACLAAAGLFFALTLVAAGYYMTRKKQIAAAAEEAAREAAEATARSAKSAAQSILADPMLLAAGLQVVRAVGIKRLIPILAIGGVALGYFMSRNAAAASEAPDETQAGL